MSRYARHAFVALILAATLVIPAAASAGGPGVWTAVTGVGQSNLQEIGLARDTAGSLRAFWRVTGATDGLSYRSISPVGAVGAAVALPNPNGWKTLTFPAALYWSGTWRLFFGALSPSGAGEYGGSLYTAFDDGSGWQMPKSPVSDDVVKQAWAATTVSALVTSDGTPVQAWDQGGAVYVHTGLSTSSPQGRFEQSPNGGYPGLAQSDDAVFAAWESIKIGDPGVRVALVNKSTSAPISTWTLPGSWQLFNGKREFDLMMQKTPIAGRPGGAVYVAYPTGYPVTNTVRVWKVTSAGPAPAVAVSPGGAEKSWATITTEKTAPQKLWVLWSEKNGSRYIIKARRSNSKATAWGATSSVLAPTGTVGLWRLGADGGSGRVDVVALLQNSSGYVTRHTQLLPTLSASWTPARAKVGTRFTATVKVTDAGEPVKGATVVVDGAKVVTGATGVATIKRGPYSTPRKLAITVSKSGFVSARGSISIVR